MITNYLHSITRALHNLVHNDKWTTSAACTYNRKSAFNKSTWVSVKTNSLCLSFLLKRCRKHDVWHLVRAKPDGKLYLLIPELRHHVSQLKIRYPCLISCPEGSPQKILRDSCNKRLYQEVQPNVNVSFMWTCRNTCKITQNYKLSQVSV